MNHDLETASEILKRSCHSVCLTGAGISVASGIPDFRGEDGFWKKYDPSKYAGIESFINDPAETWKMFFDLIKMGASARPNEVHNVLSAMEDAGIIKAIITQNIDGLHQKAGSRHVIELHGNLNILECGNCGRNADAEPSGEGKRPPVCSTCGSVLKPGIVMFGEQVPFAAYAESRLLASSADAMLIVGTSASVAPASDLPYIAKKNRAKLIEINKNPTGLTGWVTDVFLQGDAADILQSLFESITS
ncbi:MAG: NAD-dependent deacylase [Spirochaetes bacterium]|nr:NAD-dependent deacylase [Spirochaetota bacterium]